MVPTQRGHGKSGYYCALRQFQLRQLINRWHHCLLSFLDSAKLGSHCHDDYLISTLALLFSGCGNVVNHFHVGGDYGHYGYGYGQVGVLASGRVRESTFGLQCGHGHLLQCVICRSELY